MPSLFKWALLSFSISGFFACSHVDESVYTLEKPVVETRSSSSLSSSSSTSSSSSLSSVAISSSSAVSSSAISSSVVFSSSSSL